MIKLYKITLHLSSDNLNEILEAINESDKMKYFNTHDNFEEVINKSLEFLTN
jgi:hypothetical protein